MEVKVTTPVLLLAGVAKGAPEEPPLYVGTYGELPVAEGPAAVLEGPAAVDEASQVVTPTETEVVEVRAGQLATLEAQEVMVISEVE